MSSRIVDKGGFTSPVPSNIDEESDPANDPPAPDEAAAADAAAVIAAEDKAQAKKEEEEEEADAIAPLSGGNVPTIPPPPACKNLDQLMSSLPPLPKLEDITPQTHGGCTYFVFHLLWTLSYQQRFYFLLPSPPLLFGCPSCCGCSTPRSMAVPACFHRCILLLVTCAYTYNTTT